MSLHKSNIFVFLLLFSQFMVRGQNNDNLSQFYTLIDSSVILINSHLSDNNSYSLKVISPPNLELLKERSIFTFSKMNISEKISDNPNKIEFTLSSALTEYPDLFRDGLLGDYLVVRKISLKCNYFIESESQSTISNELYLAKTDTVNYENQKTLENSSLPFTKGKIPAEPFFSGLLEPIVAIGTVIVTVVLFFTVRSK